jgi:UDP-sugar pyrophosphorylase
MELYGCGARVLALAGAEVAPAEDFAANDIVVPAGPRVVLHPSLACTFDEMKRRVAGGDKVKITSSSSVLVVEGEVTLEDLELDGALVVKACAGAKVTIKGLKVRNKGWTYAPASGGDEVDALRGFVVQKNETETLVFDQPGEYVVP